MCVTICKPNIILQLSCRKTWKTRQDRAEEVLMRSTQGAKRCNTRLPQNLLKCYILLMYEVKVDTLLVVFQHGFVQSFDSGVDNLRRYINVIVMLMMVAVARAVGIVR